MVTQDPSKGDWEQVKRAVRAIEKYWAPVLACVGAVLFTFRYLSYLGFYGPFGVSPEEVGLGYSEALLQAIIATTFLAVGMGIWVGFSVRGWGAFALSLGRPFIPRKRPQAGEQREPSRWRFIGAGVVFAVAIFQAYLVVGGVWYGLRAEDGEPLGYRTPQSYLEWHAERVTVRLVPDSMPGLHLSPTDCTLFLGRADGTVVLWNWTDKETVRIPASNIVLEMGQAQKPCAGS